MPANYILENKYLKLSYIFTTLISVKIFVLIKDIILARQIGPSNDLDNYFLVLSVLNFPIGIYTSFSTLIIMPLLIKGEQNNEKDEFVFEWLGFTLLLGASLTFLAACIFSLLKTEITSSTFLVYLFFSYSFLMLVVFINNLSNVKEQHTVLWFEVIVPVTITAFLIFNPSLNTLVLGSVVGYIVHALIALVYFKKKEFLQVKFSFRSTKWKELGRIALIVLLVLVITDLLKVLDLLILNDFGEGNVSSFSFSDKVVGVIQSVSMLALGRFLIPKFTRQNNMSDNYIFMGKLMKSVIVVFFMMLLFSISIQLISENFSHLLYIGKKFTLKDNVKLVGYFNWSSWQFPFYITSAIMVYYFSAQMQYQILLKQLCLSMLFKFFFIVFFYKRLNSYSVPASNIIFYAAMSVYLFIVLYKYRNKLIHVK
jgi:peptidoglycan biosynthesis protein MviN/MurJ (putative lipid II flippase)